MSNRIDTYAAAPELIQQWVKATTEATRDGLEHSLKELVKIRASQLNGCARCLDMHIRDARASGETEERVYMLSAWRESDLYTPREKAALA
jgi:AhpD family alkylhydroperoxidase